MRKDNGFEKFITYCLNNKKLKYLIEKNKYKLEKIFHIYKKDLNNFGEILEIVDVYFDKNFKLNKDEKLNEEFTIIFEEFKSRILNINEWTRENIQENIEDFLKIKNLKFPILGKPVRFILINSYSGPSISDIFMILGKKDSIDRLNQYIEIN